MQKVAPVAQLFPLPSLGLAEANVGGRLVVGGPKLGRNASHIRILAELMKFARPADCRFLLLAKPQPGLVRLSEWQTEM